MRRNIKQLRAISYAHTKALQKKADKLLAECRAKGLSVSPAKYPSITIKRCQLALGEFKQWH